MSTPDIICTYFTLAGNVSPFDQNTASPVSLLDRAEAAGAAGYKGLGFGADDIANLLDSIGASEVNSILDHNGLVHRELEVLLDWFVTDERRIASDRQRQRLLSAAQAIGARHIKVGADITGKTWPLSQIVDEFATLCIDAAKVGTAITIELFPTSNLPDLQIGRAVVEGAGQPNGGLLLDSWHMVRGHINMASIAALPPGIINHVELDDGPLYPSAGYIEDTITSRVAPGEGGFPLEAFIDAIKATGYDGLYGVEILSDEYRRMPVREAARRSFEPTRKLLQG